MGYKKTECFTINLGFTSTNPGDSSTYYLGWDCQGLEGNQGRLLFYIPKSCNLRKAYIVINSTSVNGSAEDWSLYIRKNNTTDYLIETVSVSALQRVWDNASMLVPFAEGDYFEVKMVTPAWVTNPEGSRGKGTLLFQY